MNSTATTTNDLKKGSQEQLQIDVDLANSTDLTAASSYKTPVSNRTQNDDDISDEWKIFYKDVDKSPPKAARDIDFSIAVEKANSLLRRSEDREFANKSFENLTNDQKAIMMLMVTKKMDQCFKDSPDGCAKVLVGALKPETEKYKSMMSFVRRGGDRACRCPSTAVKPFVQICNKFVMGFLFKKGITIFDVRKNMVPFLHLQRDCSYICTFMACSALLYYHSYDIESQSAIRANISRYIRDEIDGLKIANLTLTTKKGAHLHEILGGLMKSFGTDEQEYEKIPLHQDEASNYTLLRLFLQRGRPFALRIEGFPGLNTLTETRFAGKISDYYKTEDDGNRPELKDRSYLAVVCIGIKPRKGETPPMLLLQDSCYKRPAFSIGLDLLMDMGSDELQLCTLPINWKPNPGMRYEVTNKSSVSFAGSPMSFDKNGKPCIVTSEKPVQVKREDMSRYLHKTEPGQPLVFFT